MPETRLTEKDMEDAIAAHPGQYISERELTLVERQLRIGSYRFDLLFQDRHHAKLIVEIQKGTLDREHTYKILDYYDEFREQNPFEFIDIMVIANRIPGERKRRLESLGIAYKEISEDIFLRDRQSSDISIDVVHEEEKLHIPQDVVASESESAKIRRSGKTALGPSPIIELSRDAIAEVINTEDYGSIWQLGDNERRGSLTVAYFPVTQWLPKGMKSQIWMERPSSGTAICKFEICGRSGLKELRERIAAELRKQIVAFGLPPEVEASSGSTLLRRKIPLPISCGGGDYPPSDSDERNAVRQKFQAFFKFLNKSLSRLNFPECLGPMDH